MFSSSTQLPFPLKKDGYILSAVSSSNGPCENSKKPIFKNIKLKALVWSNSTVSLEDYDHKSGYPLTNNEFTNGLVSYNLNDHPGKIFRPLMKNRFLLMGTLNSNQSKNDNLIVIMIVTNAIIEVA